MKFRVIVANAESEARSDQTIITQGDLLDHVEELVYGDDPSMQLVEGDTIEIRVFD